MGLDTVEIVMGWEAAFGISIPDEVASRLTTPRAATDYILSRVATRPAEECARQQCFYRLRRGLRSAHQAEGVAPLRMRPSTPLAELCSRAQWPRVWADARSHTDNRWPERAPLGGWWMFRRCVLGDLVRLLADGEAQSARVDGEPWTREQVSVVVRQVVFDVVGARHFGEDVHFVEELGVD